MDFTLYGDSCESLGVSLSTVVGMNEMPTGSRSRVFANKYDKELGNMINLTHVINCTARTTALDHCHGNDLHYWARHLVGPTRYQSLSESQLYLIQSHKRAQFVMTGRCNDVISAVVELFITQLVTFRAPARLLLFCDTANKPTLRSSNRSEKL